MDADATAARFFAALERRDFAAIAECFAEDARFAALTPKQLREQHGRDEAAARYESWFSGLERFELLEAEAVTITDRLRLRYRVRGRHPEHGWWVNEHTGYAVIREGLIGTMTLTCSGFRPAEPPS
jgi:hypothetical protein